MKQTLLFALLFSVAQTALAQNMPQPITPQVLQKIKTEVEKDAQVFKQKLVQQDGNSDDFREFALDTFRIEHIFEKRLELDYSTGGMNTTMDERTAAYDKLMNKYYQKLLKLLEPADQKKLISTQKTWLAFRDAEADLLGMITQPKYSGGGTIQSNIRTSSYSELVVRRTIQIFNYFDGITVNK